MSESPLVRYRARSSMDIGIKGTELRRSRTVAGQIIVMGVKAHLNIGEKEGEKKKTPY